MRVVEADRTRGNANLLQSGDKLLAYHGFPPCYARDGKEPHQASDSGIHVDALKQKLREVLPPRLQAWLRRTPAAEGAGTANEGRSVLIDTSVIIDGRIADISHTGFISGTILVPKFVLNELQHIADSPDALRRNRGRRGLEVLNRLTKEAVVPVRFTDMDVPGVREVDDKLVNLSPGIAVTVEIKTGTRRIISYLLSPLLRYKQEVLRER